MSDIVLIHLTLRTYSASRVVDLRHVKEHQAEIRASEQNLSDFSRSL